MDNNRENKLRRLADQLNDLPAPDVPLEAAERETARRLREPGRGISEQDILADLLRQYQDQPEICERLRQDFINNGGKLG